MGKPPKKKGGKKNVQKEEEPSQSSVSVEEPTSPDVPEAEVEDDSNLSAAARKRKEKKEKKERSLQALQALQGMKKLSISESSKDEPSAKDESTCKEEPTSKEEASKPEPETPTEAPSQTQSEAAAMPSQEKPPPETAKEPPKPAEEEEFGLGLGLSGTRKKKPKKKKAEPAPTAEAQQASAPQTADPLKATPTSPAGAPVLVQMPEPAHAAAPGPWSKSGSGKSRGWTPVPLGTMPDPPARLIPQPTPVPQATPIPQSTPTAVVPTARAPKSMEPTMCRYQIPNKIPGNRVRAAHIRVMVNYLEMEFKSLKIYRYDVSITPDKPKKMLPDVFLKVKNKFFANELIAFDQMKNCYSLNALKNITTTERFHATVELLDQNQRSINFDVSLKATGVVDLENIKNYMRTRASSLCHPTEEIQCIDVILRQGALESYVKAGRQFFKRPSRPIDLGFGYEMWTGLFQSAIFTNKAFINIDVAHKGFPRHQSLLDAMIKDFNLDPTKPLDNQRGCDYFAAFVKGLKVVATLVGNTPSAGHRREFICNGLVGPPHDLVFTITESDGRTRKTSVAEYFAKDKNYRLRYPRLNCLWVGNKDRCIYFPIELLHVAEGQALTRQLNEQQISKMVKEAATPPDERLKKIKEVISNMKYSQNRDFKRFGLEISEKFYTVKAKVLEPPVLEIGNGKVTPRKGQWQANKLLKPEALTSWALIAVDTDSRNDYGPMIDLIVSTGGQLGMAVSKPKFVNVNAKMKMLHSILMNAYRDVRFVFIIVSARGRDDYHKVKQLAEREVGILTQCIKEATARRMNQMTAKNILLKVNSKLMGINQAIDMIAMPKCIKDTTVMIVGADVTHPSPDQSNVPSIAAVTASIDPKCYMYNIELSIQTPKKEMIVEFEDMMFDHLKVYKDRNQGRLPKKIFVFRDGVSEGQFSQVMNSELAAVHSAYQRMAGMQNKPEVLFLLVQKRHHTRLFNDGPNVQYNVEPGTVVDTDIVHSSELDFYLVSHQAIKGTARPTRYHTVCNDGKIPDDEVEQLTYYLCHLYSRCMRSVSYPTPTYYAHLACLRARSLTHGEKFDNRELERKPKRLHVLDKMLQFSRMFFV
uniref:Argonaute 2-PEa n=1 Tax=Spodoptera frugiperda TaxID=7108 RepID=A0A2P1DMB4_SPOFR|nr:Argonaute 2-PEa [Spodoptera frugiperda]